MSHDHQPPPYPYPYPPPPPVVAGLGGVLGSEPPMRIQVAIRFLNDITAKTAVRGTLTDQHGLETIPGQELTTDEEGAREAALEVLRLYFYGKLPPDVWDQQETGIKYSVVRGLNGGNAPSGEVVPCPACGNSVHVRDRCRLCRGSGLVTISPVERGGE